MALALEGDAVAYKTLLLTLSSSLRLYYLNNLVRYGRSPSEAEDLVQEVLLAIHSRKSTYDPKQPLSPWVYGIARYKLVDYLRRRRTVDEVPLEDIEEVGVNAHTHVENGIDIEGLLAKIPAHMQTAVRLMKLEGVSALEAAARAGSSETAVRVNAHRGVKAMIAKLKGGFISENK